MEKILEEQLRVIASNNLIMRALNEVFDEEIELPNIEKTDDDKLIGEKYRAYSSAVCLVDKILQKIESYRQEKPQQPSFNKAK